MKLLFLLLPTLLLACSPKTQVTSNPENQFRQNFFSGTGLNARGIVKRPPITDKSDLTGTVVVKVCVNHKGRVVSAEFVPKGGARPDDHLINLTLENVRQWVFEKSSEKIQCGEITFRFQTQ